MDSDNFDELGHWDVKNPMKMDNKFKFSKFSKMSFENIVGPEPMGEVISTSYNTIWSCVFTLDPIKEVKNEIWLIQDIDAPRRSI